MSDHQFERAVTDWLEDGTDRTPGRAIDGVLLAIKTTPQERDLRIPWRFPRMLALPRASGIAAVAIVAVVGAGGLIFLNNRAPGETGGPPATPPATPQSTEAPTPEPTPEPTPTPTPEPTPEPSYPGISGWVPYTSEVYGFTVSYPEGWEVWPAEREFKPGGRRDRPTEDVFVAGQPDDLGLSAFLAPAGKGADFESVSGLTAWAEKYCNDTERGDCDTFAERAVPMCIDVGSDPCKPAILVPSLGAQPDGSESAFIPYWQGETDASDPDKVLVFTTGRGDEWQGAFKYGGMVELLKSILSQLDVTEAP